jgi:hypothetical protein
MGHITVIPVGLMGALNELAASGTSYYILVHGRFLLPLSRRGQSVCVPENICHVALPPTLMSYQVQYGWY